VENFSILDVGSGPECLLKNFLSHRNISFLDPLIENPDGLSRICGDINSTQLDERTFDCVVAIDVLEHIPASFRVDFLRKISSLSNSHIVLGFPTSDTTDAYKIDQAINDRYRAVFGTDYPWLEEHARFGLPSLSETISQLVGLGWHCQTIGHGHAAWLRELLGILICIWDNPEMKEFCFQISREFNDALYKYDFQEPYYREFIIASRVPMDKINLGESSDFSRGQSLFTSLLERLKDQYIPTSLNGFLQKNSQIDERDRLILELNEMMRSKVSELNEMMRSKVSERDKQILELNEMMRSKVSERDKQILELNKILTTLNSTAEEVSLWAKSLQESLIQKDIEAVKISDWAQELLQLLERRNALISTRIKAKIISTSKIMKMILKSSLRLNFLERIKYFVSRLKHHITVAAVKSSIKENNGRLIIGFPIITWEFRWQRPQHILSGLRDGGFSILYLAISLLSVSKRLKGEKEAGSKIGFNKLDKHVNQIWLNSSESINIYTDVIGGDNLHNVLMGLNYFLDIAKPSSLIYMVQFPGWGPVAIELKKKYGGKIIFDCMDDHAGFDTATNDVLKSENELIKAADLVITSSELLYKKVGEHTNNLLQIKNGTEFQHFNNSVRNGLLDYLSDAPIVGYYGAISSWFDAELVSYCAFNRPDINFVLIGSTFGAELGCIEELSNVHFLGEIPYSKLPGFLAYFDVCTIPFKLIPLTFATNPVKFYEYLSAGKPVVSVNLPELIPYSNNCYLANNPAEFLSQIDSALSQKNDQLLISRRIQLAKDNSWGMRVGQLLNHDLLK
jgi:glycosyltransferase involved in cell wall biosynthesis